MTQINSSVEKETRSLLSVTDDVYRGYLDNVEDGLIVDYKTTSDIDNLLLELRTSPQLALYALSEISNGNPVSGISYRIMKKPTIRLKKNQTTGEYIEEVYEWYFIDQESKIETFSQSISENMLEEARLWIEHGSLDIQRCRRLGYWPQDFTSCYNHFSRCEFADVCELKSCGGNHNYLLRTEYERYSPEKKRESEDNIVGYSTTKAFRECAFKYYNRHELMLRKKGAAQSTALSFGVAFHNALEVLSQFGIDAVSYQCSELMKDSECALSDQNVCNIVSMIRVASEFWQSSQPSTGTEKE